jgi:hypothetical protein
MATVSKAKAAVVYIAAIGAASALGLFFAATLELFIGPTTTTGEFGDISPSLQQIRWMGGSSIGLFFCLAFVQFAFINRYWKFFVPVMVFALLISLTLGLFLYALIYAMVGGLLGWIVSRFWTRRRA